MSEKINYTYTVKSNYCSDFMLVPKIELGESSESTQDIINVNAVGDTDEDGVDFLRIRTRYYWTSVNNIDNYLHCFYESRLYIEPNPSIVATELEFVKIVLEAHDKFAHECLSTKKIEPNKHEGFEGNLVLRQMNYELHARNIQNWMIDSNK